METIGKGILILMLSLKSFSPTIGNRVPTSGNFIPDPGRPPIIRIAMIPFENVSSDQNATDRLNGAFLTYLLHTQIVGVVDPLLVEQQLFNLKVRKPSEITLKVAAELKANLGIDALLIGRITAYQVDNTGGDSIPVIAVTARLLDLDTLGIMWSSSIVRKGNDKSVLFDVGRIDTLSDLNQLVANDLASALGKDVRAVMKGYPERRLAAGPPAAVGIPPIMAATAATGPAIPASAQAQAPAAPPQAVAPPQPIVPPPAAPRPAQGAHGESSAPAAETPAAAAAHPSKNMEDFLLEIAEYERGELRPGSHGAKSVGATYYKDATPFFITIVDCGSTTACEALRDAAGAQQPGPPVNGDNSTQMKTKMGLLVLSVVRGRYLMKITGGEAMLENMRVAGREILKVIGR